MTSAELKTIKKDGVWTVNGRPREKVELISHVHPLPGISQITFLLTLPPNSATPSHTHNGASATGLMVSGSSLNQMNQDEPKVYHAGESWYEAPGCHHVRSENVSHTEEAKFYAVLIIKDEVIERDGYESLVLLDVDMAEKKGQGHDHEQQHEHQHHEHHH